MIVTNSAREKNTATFDVTLDAGEFEKFVNGAYQKNKSKIMVSGFRKGHAPRLVIEGMYGKDVFYEDAMNDAAPEAFAFAVKELGLEPVGRPSAEKSDVTEDKGLALSFKVDVWPEVTLGEYRGLTAEKPVVNVTDADVDEEIEKLRKQNGRLVTAEREAANGDTVNIDYLGTIDGVPFEGGSAEGHNLQLGSGSFVPGFEEKLLGVKAGEERDLDILFDDDYVKPLGGKAAVFHVKCNEVKEEQLPEVDGEFAKDNDFDSVDELKESIRKRLTEEREKAAENAFEDALVDKAVENMTAEIPASMIEEKMDSIYRDYAQYMASQGMKLDQYLQMIGSDFATFRESSRPTATKQVRTEVLLKAVAAAEKVEITDEDREAEYNDIAGKYGMKLEDVKKAIDTQALDAELLRKKTAKLITDSGVAVAPQPKTEETPAAEAGEKPKTRAKKAKAPKAEESEKEAEPQTEE